MKATESVPQRILDHKKEEHQRDAGHQREEDHQSEEAGQDTQTEHPMQTVGATDHHPKDPPIGLGRHKDLEDDGKQPIIIIISKTQTQTTKLYINTQTKQPEYLHPHTILPRPQKSWIETQQTVSKKISSNLIEKKSTLLRTL